MSIVSLVALASASFVAGCELIASVDHDKIAQTTSTYTSSTTGSGGGATSSATTATASSSASTTGSSSSTGGCSSPSDCPAPASDCDQAACTMGTCGTPHKAAHATCSMGGGKVCDGNGMCEGCVDGTDCAATPATSFCGPAHACLAGSCNDLVKDNGETDVDCGGPCGPTCANTKVCVGAGDCLSGYCSSLTCAGCTADAQCVAGDYCATPGANTGVCKPKVANGITCGGDNECSNAHCYGTATKVCCDTACAGNCQSCLMTETGMTAGKCLNVTAGQNPKSACSSAAGDCNTGTCNASGACGVKPVTTACGVGPTCTGSNSIKPQDTCNGTLGTCPSATSAACNGHLTCMSATACLGTCPTNDATGDGSCTPTAVAGGAGNYWCNGSTCVVTQATGGACTRNSQCMSGVCTPVDGGPSMCQ